MYTLSWYVIMNSVMGSRTFPGKLSRPQTCMTTPSYTKVTQCECQRLRQKCLCPLHHQSRHMPQNRRATFWSVIYGRNGLGVVTTCVSWTLMPSLIWRRHWRGVFTRWWRKKSRTTWRLTYINNVTFRPLSSQLTVYWVWKRRLP